MYKLYIKENTDSKSLLKYALNDNNIFDYSISYNEYGKPYLNNKFLIAFEIGESQKEEIYDIVNKYLKDIEIISDKEIGLDIEKIKYNEKVAKRVLNVKEMEILNNSKNKDEMFTIFWTSKESYVKLLGIGIGYGLKNVDTTKMKVIIKKYNNYILAISKER